MQENLDRAVHADLLDCMDLEVTQLFTTLLTEAHRETARASVEKRNLRFSGP